MEIATLRQMSVAELKSELVRAEREKFGLKQGVKMGEVKETHKYKQVKKEVAQIRTLLTEKESQNQK